MYQITQAKNHDYSWSEYAFNNFELIEELTSWKVKTAEWILVRMTDKISRVANLLSSEAKVADEKITDTLLDLANYSIILKIYLDTKLD